MQLSLRAALSSGQLADVTKALSELGEQLGYRLRSPHTDVLELRAREENDRFAVQFRAMLFLHYSGNDSEGLVFTVSFGGEAYADSPSPPIHDLFYAGLVDSLTVQGYGRHWRGKPSRISRTLAVNLELPSEELVLIDLKNLESQVSEPRD